jgi:hypothetical protein
VPINPFGPPSLLGTVYAMVPSMLTGDYCHLCEFEAVLVKLKNTMSLVPPLLYKLVPRRDCNLFSFTYS